MSKTLKTITVSELIDLLQNEDPNANVIFSCDYGDHSHTEQALGLRGDAEVVQIEKSAYSNSGFAVMDEMDEASDADGPVVKFLKIS